MDDLHSTQFNQICLTRKRHWRAVQYHFWIVDAKFLVVFTVWDNDYGVLFFFPPGLALGSLPLFYINNCVSGCLMVQLVHRSFSLSVYINTQVWIRTPAGLACPSSVLSLHWPILMFKCWSAHTKGENTDNTLQKQSICFFAPNRLLNLTVGGFV